MAKYLLHHLKFYQQLFLLPLLSQLMILNLAEYFNNAKPQVIIPVPLHRFRLLRRGFNQAHELAKRLGRAYHIPVKALGATKIKRTPAQANLSASLRKTNVTKSFKVSLTMPIEHVLLIDDVFTTGATVNALAHEFRRAGVKRVDVITLFRAYF